MSVQINVDPTKLTHAQREAVAGFILAFPDAACTGSCHKGDKPTAPALIAAIANEPQVLHAESVVNDPAYQLPSFGDVDPAAAFGGGAVPLVPGVPPAPSTAGALPFSTAPVVLPATSTAPATVPAPPAVMPANGAAPAVPPTASPAPAGERDAAGLPWDSRIHASSKAKVADGTWRKKKQLDPALLASVEAELRALLAVPFTAAPSVAPAPTTPTCGAASSAAVVPTPPSVPPVPGVAGAIPANVATIEPTRDAYVALIGRASAAIQGGKITQQQVTEICAAQGVPMLPLLANRLDLLPGIAGQIDALIASR